MTQKDKTKEELVEEIKLLQKRIEELKTVDTESKQQQQQMRRLATVVCDSNDAITLKDFDGRIIAWNRGAELMYGYSEKEALRMHFRHLAPPNKETEHAELIRRMMAGETVHSFETQRVAKDGRILDVWLTVTKVVDDAGKPIGIATTERDITERKEANEKLQASEARYRRLFEAAKDGIFILDANSGKIIDVNPFMEKLMGYSREELLGKELWELGIFKDIANSKEAFLELQNKEYGRYEDLPLQHKNGSKIEVEFVSNAYAVNHRKVIQCNVRDIAGRKKAERALMEVVKAKSAFTSMVSHELRTPLAALKESVSQVLEGMLGAINEDQGKFLGIAKNNIDRLARLINEVLDFQTLETGKMVFKIQENDINEVVKEAKETMSIIAKEKGLDFILNLDKELPKIKFDRDKISQVLTNVVNNSIKLTEKGSITISTTRGNNIIQVSVKDTGPGIKEEDMPRLFQQYEQLERKTGGTGLGLAISLEIIKAHGGKIWAESIFGHGTTMHFLLPIEERRRQR